MNKLVLNSIRINFLTPYNLNKMIHVKHQVYPFGGIVMDQKLRKRYDRLR